MPIAGVGLEDAVRQPDDCVEVALLQQVFLQPRLDALAEQRAVRQHHGGAAIGPSGAARSAPGTGQPSPACGNGAGSCFSMPSSSRPPKGGLVTTMSTRSDWV